jgi:hypothetical protein
VYNPITHVIIESNVVLELGSQVGVLPLLRRRFADFEGGRGGSSSLTFFTTSTEPLGSTVR